MLFRKKKEERTDDLAAAIVANRETAAAREILDAATATEEVVAGLYERAFSQANIEGVVMQAGVLGRIGRALATNGQAVMVDEQTLASTVDVSGGTSPMSWRYLVHLPSPSGTVSRYVGGMDVMHFRINSTVETPWRGQSPIDLGGITRTVLRRAEGAIAAELSGAVGKIMTVPAGTPEQTIALIKADLKALNGKTTLPESTAGGWGQGAAVAPQRDWQPVRIGPEPPVSMVQLRKDAAMMVLGAAGVPVELVDGSEGSGSREAWRQFLHSTIQPLGKIVVAELRYKTGRRVSIDWGDLMASDLSGRARAFQSLVKSGMDLDKAAALAGLMMESE